MSRFIANINSLEKLTFTSKVSDFQGNRQASPRVSHWMMLRTFEKQGSATSFLRSAQKKRRSFSKKRRSFFQKRGRFSEKCRRKFLKRRSFLKSSRTLAEKHPPISPLLLVKDYKNSASPSGEDHDALKARSKETDRYCLRLMGIVPRREGSASDGQGASLREGHYFAEERRRSN